MTNRSIKDSVDDKDRFTIRDSKSRLYRDVFATTVKEYVTSNVYDNVKKLIDAVKDWVNSRIGIITIIATDYGVDNTGAVDVRNSLSNLHDAIPEGGAKIVFPRGTYLLDATGESPTINNPSIGMKITKNNVKIFADGANFVMKGVSKSYLLSIDDKSSSGRDVFTFFSFVRQKGGEFHGGTCVGENNDSTTFRYQSPRAKFIGAIGGEGLNVFGVTADKILGNGICATPSDSEIDGVYEPCYGVNVSSKTKTTGCWEGGVNFMGNTFNCSYQDSESNNNGNGFEAASTGLIVSDISCNSNSGSNVSISSGDFNISNVTIDGDGVASTKDSGHGFVISSSSSAMARNGIVSNVKIRNISGFSLFVYPTAEDISFSNFKINNGNTTGDDTHSDVYIVGNPSGKIKDMSIKDFNINSNSKWNITIGNSIDCIIDSNTIKGATSLSINDSGNNNGLIVSNNLTNQTISTASADTYAQNNITPTSVRQFYKFVAIGGTPSGEVWRVGDRIINTTTYPGYDIGFVCKTPGADGVAQFYSMGVVS